METPLYIVVTIIAIRLILYLMGHRSNALFTARIALLIGRLLALLLAFGCFVGDQLWLAAGVLAAGVFPGRLARHVLVPLGVPHLTYWLYRTVHLGFGKTDAIFYELCARLRFGRALSPTQLEALEQRLHAAMPASFCADLKVRGGALTSLAMLHALRGERDQARELFLVAQAIPRSIRASGSRELSQGWLLAEATARRDFAEVLRLCSEGPRTLQRLFFGYLARKHLGHPLSPLDRLGSQCAWAFQGPVAAFRLRALARRAERLPPLPSVSDFASARHALVSAACRPAGSVTRAELRLLASSLEQLQTSQALQNTVCALAQAAGHDQAAFFDVGLATHELLEEIAELVEELWRSSPPEKAPPEESADLIYQVQDRIERRVTTELEQLVERLAIGSIHFPALEDCWRDWARLRAVIRDAVHLLPQEREALIASVRTPLINYAAGLFNDANSKVLAFDIFHWLLRHAPKTDENYKLLKDNMRLARGIV
jgi:hypothetical protein